MELVVDWIGGGLLWISSALSTLRSATSPRLFAIRLSFAQAHTTNRPVETTVENIDHDLRRVADEVARIEREFKGVVNVTVPQDPAFRIAFDTLDVRFHLCRAGNTWSPC